MSTKKFTVERNYPRPKYMKKCPVFMIVTKQYCQDSNNPWHDLQSQHKPYQNPDCRFCRIWQADHKKNHKKGRDPQQPKPSWERTIKVKVSHFLIWKLTTKWQQLRLCGTGTRTNGWTEENWKPIKKLTFVSTNFQQGSKDH